MKKIAKFITLITWVLLFILIFTKKDLLLKSININEFLTNHLILILIPIHIIFSILILPCSALTIIYGAVVGFKYGVILSLFTSYISSLITFQLANTKFNPFIFYDLKKVRKFIINNSKYRENFLIFFSYINPFFPGSSLGYVFGITAVKKNNFIIYSFLGMIPLNFILVFFGDFIIKVNL